MRLYTMFDRVAGQFQQPFVSVNDATAIRMFKNTLAQAQLQPYSPDMDLFYLGDLDANTGCLDTEECPKFIWRISEGEV